MNSEHALEDFKTADRLYRDADYLGALETLDKLDESFPGTKSILFARARCLFKLNRAHESIAICDELIDTFQYDKAEALKARVMKAHGIEESHADLDTTQTFGPLNISADSKSDF